MKVKSLSCIRLFATPWTVAYQAPPSMGFSRQECCAGVDCHFLLQGIFQSQESNPGLLHCRQMLYHLSYQGSPNMVYVNMDQVGKKFLKDFLSFVVILSFLIGLLCLLIQIEEYKKLCELKRKETYAKKKELDKLRLTMTKMRETVTTSTVVRKNKNWFFMSDHRLLNIHCLKNSRSFLK